VALTTSQLASLCPARNCYTVTCPVGSNNCTYVADFNACGACTIANPTIPAATFCYSSVCVDAKSTTICSSLVSSQQASCSTAVAANGNTGYYVGQVLLSPGPCQGSDFCTNYTCQENPNTCVASSRTCSPPNQCFTASCSASQSSCVTANLTQPALNALCGPIPSCKIPSCIPSGGCSFADDPSLTCACSVGASCQSISPDTYCTQTVCV
jgi:hypothetical protein